ncbi:helix-turn-helix domain-containing protein [Tolypothrix sp. NIES-4075]|uniref:helix-turn-helix domain-containing protein n=1 Tax=Tolypothrix sp. NIES-4075 TaxID=2005459 RepID=UPI000B5C5CA4|nr:helix-turn-helix transcriptional regulator [Tolypothrix sp. NIES-4075]
MPVRNTIKEFLEKRGITRYQLYKETGIAPATAYRLYEDPTWIPQVGVLNKICDTYRIFPGELITWIPPEETS